MSEFEWLKRAHANDAEDLEGRVIAALRTVYDPEIPVNIYDLGLVYALDLDEDAGRVDIRMTLTAPGCPVAQTFPGTVEEAVRSVRGVDDVHVELVWEPPWSRDRMSDAARLQLGCSEMSDWVEVAAVENFPPGTSRTVDVDGAQVAVFNLDGTYYAIHDVCTHDGGMLTGGEVDGDMIVCPRHGARFCIRTGKALTPPAYEDVATFPVRVEAGLVSVRDARWDESH